MILKQEKNNEVTDALYASSTICASSYDRTTKDLTITFKNGGQYRYKDVSITDYTRFEIADSQGVVLNTHIKKHTFEKLGTVDMTKILLEIESLDEKPIVLTLEETQKELLVDISGILSYFIRNEKITDGSLTSLKASIAAYEKLKK